MVGRKAKPTKLKILTGNPGRRPLNKSEPQPAGKLPKRPGWLTGYARKEWERAADELDALGLLTSLDYTLFVLFCYKYGEFVQLVKDVRKEGRTFYDIKSDMLGNEIKVMKSNPKVMQMNNLSKEIRLLCSEFGMSPSSRCRLQVGPKEAVDPMDTFLSGKKAR